MLHSFACIRKHEDGSLQLCTIKIPCSNYYRKIILHLMLNFKPTEVGMGSASLEKVNLGCRKGCICHMLRGA